MALRPAAIIFVNNDLTDNVKNYIVKQLHITQVMDGYAFDTLVTGVSGYVDTVKQLNQRIMVVRSFEELNNRNLADVVIFVAHGLATILHNNFGPPGITHEIVQLTWGKLCVF